MEVGRSLKTTPPNLLCRQTIPKELTKEFLGIVSLNGGIVDKERKKNLCIVPTGILNSRFDPVNSLFFPLDNY